MEEIAKVRRVIQKADPTGPHETLLVLDANFGQNALMQVKAFDKSINVTGLVVTKLDGTAKGGVSPRSPASARSRSASSASAKASTTCAPSSRATLSTRCSSDPENTMISFSAVTKRYPDGLEALGRQFRDQRRRDGLHHRPLGRREIDPVPPAGGHRAPDLGQHRGQRAEPRRPAQERDSLPAPQLRPDLPGPEAALRPQRARQRAAAAGHRRRAARERCAGRAPRWTRSACSTARRRTRSRSPAASSSAWRSPAPSSTGRPSCSPTSRRPTWTPIRRRHPRHLPRLPSGRRHRSSSPPTTRNGWRASRRACCASNAANGCLRRRA
jgi:hypothetical protein